MKVLDRIVACLQSSSISVWTTLKGHRNNLIRNFNKFHVISLLLFKTLGGYRPLLAIACQPPGTAYAVPIRIARSLCYDSRDNITHKFEFWYLHNSLSSIFNNMKTVSKKFLSCFSKL